MKILGVFPIKAVVVELNKGFMDRGMASGNVKKFILAVVTGVASKNWGPNGAGNDSKGYNAFKGELRDDLIPYLRGNFNIGDSRDYAALAVFLWVVGKHLILVLLNALTLLVTLLVSLELYLVMLGIL